MKKHLLLFFIFLFVSTAVTVAQTTVTVNMFDSFGDGWDGAEFSLDNLSIGGSGECAEANVGTGTLDDGAEGFFEYTVNDGCYQFSFNSAGDFPSEVTWNVYDSTAMVELASGNTADVGSFTLGAGSACPVAGCTNPAAVNYDPLATCDDGSCLLCSDNAVVLNLNDSFGDGWNGAELTITDYAGCALGTAQGPFTFTTGSQESINLCLANACYLIQVTGGDFPSEVSWEILDGNNVVLASGAVGDTDFSLGGVACPIYGCTDAAASNFDPTATCDDGSCLFCVPPAGSAAIGMCDDVSGIMIDVDVTDLGDSPLTINNDAGVASVDVTTTGVTSVGPFAFGATVTITLENPNSTTCNVVLDAIVIPLQCPPANDDCENAIAVTVNANTECGAVTMGSTVASTASPQTDDVSGTPDNDVWFEFTATSIEHEIALANRVAVVGSSTDMGIGLYDATGGCDALVLSSTSDPESYLATNLTVGTLYKVRVYGWYARSSSLYAENTFDLCIGTRCDISDVTVGTPGACDPSTNTFTTEVIVTYVGEPSTGTLDVNGQSEAITGSPQTVMLVLPADGATVDVTASFSESASCSNTVTGGIVAPVSCAVECVINSITVTDQTECVYDEVAMTSTFTAEITVAFDVPPAGGTLDVTVGSTTVSTPVAASPMVVSLTGLPANGMAMDVTAAFSDDAACTSTEMGLLTAPSACNPPANDDACDAVGLTVNATEVAGDNTFATVQAGEQDGECWFGDPPSTSVWFSFVAPASGVATVTTDFAGTGLTDTQVAIYSGDCSDMAALVQVGCDEDGGVVEDFLSIANVTDMVGGDTYYVQVDGYNDDVGDFLIQVTTPMDPAPANDDCNTAEIIANTNGAGAVVGGTFTQSTGGGMPELCDGGSTPDPKDVWYEINTDAGGELIIQVSPPTNGTSDVVIAVYNSCSTDPSDAVACVDGGGPGVMETINFTALFQEEGTTSSVRAEDYFLRVYEKSSTGESFDVAIQGAALPIELSLFEVKAMRRGNEISWTTESEINSDHVNVLSSPNGSTKWSPVGRVVSLGDSYETRAYEMMDMNPYPVTYYRLESVDKDGSIEYSAIISIKRDDKQNALSVYPNPANETVAVSLTSSVEESATVNITDLAGQVVMNTSVQLQQGLNTLSLDLETLPAGVYLISMNTSDASYVKKLVRQ